MTSAVLLALLAMPPASGAEAFLTSEGVAAYSVNVVPIDPSAALWSRLPGRPLWAAPQLGFRLNDAAANRALASADPREVVVRAAYDARSIGIVLEWSDETESRGGDLDRFGDSAALQVPVRFGAGLRLPYVGMGDREQHVAISMQRAIPGGSRGRELVAAGFGSSTRTELVGSEMRMQYDAAKKRWRALFVRPLSNQGSELAAGLVPFAIAVWDGEKNERGGNKALSGWKFLRLSRFPLDRAYVRELSFGYGPGDLGDPGRGKPLVESICTACHHVGEVRTAPEGMAPDLSNIGMIATPRYLYDAVVKPDEPIVPHLFSPSFASLKMPSFDTMSKEEVADMVAYLVTLGRKR